MSLIHTWLAGDQVNASDINGNFTVASAGRIYTAAAGPAITVGQAVAIGPYQSDGGVLLDTKGTQTSTSFSINIGANTNRSLVVYVYPTTASATISAVTFNGVAMALVASNNGIGASNWTHYCFILTAPATGSHTLAITTSSGTANVNYYSFYNVAQTGTAGTSAPEAFSSTTSGSTYTPALSTIANGALVISGALGGNLSSLTGQGAYENSQALAGLTADSGQVFPAATSIATVVTIASSNVSTIMLSLAPVTAVIDGVIILASAAAATNQFFNKYLSFIGFAGASVSGGASLDVILSGVVTGLSGLSQYPKQYYLSDTPGAISTSPGTNSKKVGVSVLTTALLIQNI